MKNVSILDCTLRDGGYCNSWRFGQKNICEIISKLMLAGVEFIECGYLTEDGIYGLDYSKYNSLDTLENRLADIDVISNSQFVVMLNYGEYDIDKLPVFSNGMVKGIRLAFHKKNIDEALIAASKIISKGYKVFLQPMISMYYSEEEFLCLIDRANRLNLYAFYIVDSFGTMNRYQLSYYSRMANERLRQDIVLGFHSHNNLQLAYSNAIRFMEAITDRKKIVDTTVYGMGRGAGNLNTELLLKELNDFFDKKYIIRYVYNIMDEVISRFYEKEPWGYSLPNFISAIHHVHPNYADYLHNKRTLQLEDIDYILNSITECKKTGYDEVYIASLYEQYLSRKNADIQSFDIIFELVKGRNILLIAPGKTSITWKNVINSFIDKLNPIVISVNQRYPFKMSDFIFVSNIRRFNQLTIREEDKLIVTSNILTNNAFAIVDYDLLINNIDNVKDNACLMAIRMLIDYMDIKKIYVAGMDGYTQKNGEDYGDEEYNYYCVDKHMDHINLGLREFFELETYKNRVEFITATAISDNVRR